MVSGSLKSTWISLKLEEMLLHQQNHCLRWILVAFALLICICICPIYTQGA